jgi:hypothetical protein
MGAHHDERGLVRNTTELKSTFERVFSQNAPILYLNCWLEMYGSNSYRNMCEQSTKIFKNCVCQEYYHLVYDDL